MVTEVLFREVQAIAGTKWRRFFGVLTAALLAAVFVQWLRYRDAGDVLLLVYATGGMVSALLWVVLQFRLETEVRPDGIYVRFPPLHGRYEVFRWTEISEVSFRSYHALQEFGGWGLRFNGAGKGYIVAGQTALELRLANGRVVVISTTDPEGLEAALQKIQR